MKGRVRRAVLTVAVASVPLIACDKDVEMEFGMFVEKHVERVAPLKKEGAIAYWKAAVSGAEEDFKRYSDIRFEMERIYSDKASFDLVGQARDSGKLKDPLLRRMADILYLRYLGNQADQRLLEKIVALSVKVENRFNVFRAEVDGMTFTLSSGRAGTADIEGPSGRQARRPGKRSSSISSSLSACVTRWHGKQDSITTIRCRLRLESRTRRHSPRCSMSSTSLHRSRSEN
jgi:hypothetical protein